MADTTFVGDDTAFVQRTPVWSTTSWSGVSWSAVIAGALTAIAVSFILIALGSGIGLSLASPFSSSPSAGTLTVMGAVWLVLAQALGFATGGYLAGRLRTNPNRIHTVEAKFRDGANGLIVWAIAVVLSSLVLAAAANKAGSAAADAAGSGAAAAMTGAASQMPPIDYYTDQLLRTAPQAPATTAGATPGGAPPVNASASATNSSAQRAEVNRILVTALSPNGLSNDDRTYVVQLVSAQTGLSQDEAQKRVDNVVARVKTDATQAAETARKAGAYLSFWTFMSLLFGAACATLGGLLGGELRDEFATQRAVPTAPR